MARVFLNPQDSFALNNAATVYGGASAETLILNAGTAGVTVDQNVERLELPGAVSSYSFQQTGNLLRVYQGSVLIVRVIIHKVNVSLTSTAYRPPSFPVFQVPTIFLPI